jgi:membrane protease YdiL (CAAX protease family)
VGSFQLIGVTILGLDFENYKKAITGQLFVITFFSLIGTLTVIWFFRKYIDKKTFASLGFQKDFLKKDISVGLVVGFLIMSIGFVCLLLSGQIEFLKVHYNLLDFILSIGLFVFVAISEEIFLRGYILSNLLESFNKYIALIISALIFSLMHAANSGFNLMSMVGLFIAGLLFGLPYIYTKSLWYPIALHFSWNFFQGTIFGFNVSGKDTYSIITTKENAANIWNGGGFGFEASILSISFQIIALFIIFLIFKSRESGETSFSENKATGNIGMQQVGLKE